MAILGIIGIPSSKFCKKITHFLIILSLNPSYFNRDLHISKLISRPLCYFVADPMFLTGKIDYSAAKFNV